jgi:hypothetical protein
MPRKTVTQLYAEFENAVAAVDALGQAIEAIVSDETLPVSAEEKEFDAAVRFASELCTRTVETPANPTNPVPEMLLKIAAAGWGSGAMGRPLAKWTAEEADAPGAHAVSCLLSIREDLQAMQAAHAAAAPSR